ncbi:MAG: restriction endonuclease subunit S, partial [Bryobacterales bacterium]|nr:restriction endonuclease subunit S [Bryobacterales bacterium]
MVRSTQLVGEALPVIRKVGDRSKLASLRAYPTYKDSGVEWLGDVPKHWEVRRLKDWVGINQEVLSEGTEPNYTFRYIDIGSVGTGRLSAPPATLRFGDAPSRARRVVRRDDTLVSTVRTYLKAVWHADTDASDVIASTGFAVLTPRRGTSPKFVSYFSQSHPFVSRVVAESVGVAYPGIAEGDLAALNVCVPPLAEQTAIARFLDHADQSIRRCIGAKEKLLALLGELERLCDLCRPEQQPQPKLFRISNAVCSPASCGGAEA